DEARAHARQRSDALGIAVERDVVHERAVAVAHDGIDGSALVHPPALPDLHTLNTGTASASGRAVRADRHRWRPPHCCDRVSRSTHRGSRGRTDAKEPSVTELAYSLSSEEHDARTLVEIARRAEEAGFDSVWISDHYHPWID